MSNNNEPDRQRQLTSAFLRPSMLQIGDLKVRPITLGTVDVGRVLGLTFLFDPEVELTTDEMQRQVLTLLWIQTREPDEVLQALDDGTVEKMVRRFQFEVPLAVLTQFQGELQKTKKDTDAAAVEVVPKTGDVLEEPSPNA